MSSQKLSKMSEDGIHLLEALERENEKTNPWFAETSKGVLLLWGTKMGMYAQTLYNIIPQNTFPGPQLEMPMPSSHAEAQGFPKEFSFHIYT